MFGSQNKCALLACAAMVSSAFGASDQVEAQNRWNGAYAGLSLGVTSTTGKVDSEATCGAAACYYTNPAVGSNLSNLSIFASGSGRQTKASFGANAGYNWQSGSFVYGFEGGYHSFNPETIAAGSALIVGATNRGSSLASSGGVKASGLGLLRARVGMSVTPSLLLYGTGGLAITKLQVASAYADDRASFGNAVNGLGASESSSVKAGWTLGAGAELALDKNWSVQADYAYANFGSITTTTAVTASNYVGTPAYLTTKGSLNTNLFRAGVNYKF